jgi:hypothetical protein
MADPDFPEDELDLYLADAMKDPRFARAYRWASLRLCLARWFWDKPVSVLTKDGSDG